MMSINNPSHIQSKGYTPKVIRVLCYVSVPAGLMSPNREQTLWKGPGQNTINTNPAKM